MVLLLLIVIIIFRCSIFTFFILEPISYHLCFPKPFTHENAIKSQYFLFGSSPKFECNKNLGPNLPSSHFAIPQKMLRNQSTNNPSTGFYMVRTCCFEYILYGTANKQLGSNFSFNSELWDSGKWFKVKSKNSHYTAIIHTCFYLVRSKPIQM